ncbi:MAG: prolyl oligopeptidase family serine peptidase [Deltaproteobacteria bacterium]|nr:prolyl oligopeptidase family serine peptidase [Deltaproteobacteria bacterium]
MERASRWRRWLAAPAPPSAAAQTRPTFFDEPSEIRVIGRASAAHAPLPLVVFLAATGGTSAEMFTRMHQAVPFERYVALLPPGRPARADYLPRFRDFVDWMEERILPDLERARAQHTVDPERIYLVGFSLGGDTSWALLARRPDLFRGAVVMGSRSGARVPSRKLRLMRERGVRVAFAIGREDRAVRVSGIQRAHRRMLEAGVPTRLDLYPGEHVPPPDPEMLAALFRFVMIGSP